MQHGIPSPPEGDGAPAERNASMSNMAKLSNRAAEALDVLAGGDRFDYRLERNRHTGGEQFHYRLRRKGGQVVTGISGATFRELEAAGFLQSQWGSRTSTNTSYVLRRKG